MIHRLFPRALSALAAVALSFVSAAYSSAQSTADSVGQLQDAAGVVQQEYLVLLEKVKVDPSMLGPGAVETASQAYISSLGDLDKRVVAQIAVLQGKIAGIEGGSLQAGDKKELIAALEKQIAPLQKLHEQLKKGELVASKVSTTEGTAGWKTLYENFASISGEEKARERLSREIDDYKSSLPDITISIAINPKKNSPPQPAFSPTISATSSPTPSASTDVPAVKPGKFAKFRIFPGWFCSILVIEIGLFFVADKINSSILTIFVVVVGSVAGGYWFLNLIWRAIVTLFS
jgi:hypothetical protein